MFRLINAIQKLPRLADENKKSGLSIFWSELTKTMQNATKKATLAAKTFFLRIFDFLMTTSPTDQNATLKKTLLTKTKKNRIFNFLIRTHPDNSKCNNIDLCRQKTEFLGFSIFDENSPKPFKMQHKSHCCFLSARMDFVLHFEPSGCLLIKNWKFRNFWFCRQG